MGNATYTTSSNLDHLNVSWEKDIFRANGRPYAIALYHLLNSEGEHVKAVICTGNDLPMLPNITFQFDGRWVKHPKYGDQFEVQFFQEIQRTSRKEIIDYLCSPAIKGIGKVIAKRIYDAFGRDSLKVMDETPEMLLSIKGITKNKYKQIIESYQASNSVTKLYDFLKDYTQVSLTLCQNINAMYGVDSLRLAKEHPYSLCRVEGFDFRAADPIAKAMGIRGNSMERIESAATYVLLEAEKDGNLYMGLQEFGKALAKALFDPRREEVNSMEKVQKLINSVSGELFRRHEVACVHANSDLLNEYCVYRQFSLDSEKAVADELLTMSKVKVKPIKDIDKLISEQESLTGIKLDDNQKAAVRMSLSNSVSVITGGPGTGKTTIMRFVQDIYQKAEKGDVLLAAPTGRAARRLAESTKCAACTLHSALQISDKDEINMNDEGDKDVEINADFVIVDEASFVDIFLMRRLMRALHAGQRLLLVGDENQLQSVGAGAVLRDVLASGIVAATYLNKVFRQGSDSNIAINADRIKNGSADLVTGGDFEIHDGLTDMELEKAMLDAYYRDIDKYGIWNVACLCPVKDYAAGVNSMNTKIQQHVNPASPKKNEMVFGNRILREGDLVMELKNTDVTSNGDIGEVLDIDRQNMHIDVLMNDEIVRYTKQDAGERLTLAYAMTVHKAQGSEYDSVITCLQDQNFYMCRRSIPYTSFTRGKRIVRFFGSKNALQKAIMNDDKNLRKTLLAYFIQVRSGQVMENV